MASESASSRAPWRVLWVYPAYSAARAAEEQAYAVRMRALGVEIVPFGIPCPGGWWPFARLDERYRQGDHALHEAYAELARELERADALVAAGGSMLHPAFLDQVRVPKAMLCADDPENSANLSRPVAAHFDHCFVVNIACVDDYRGWGATADWLFPVLRPERVAQGLSRRRILYAQRDVDLALACDRAFGLGDRKARLDALLAAFPQCETRGRGWPAGEVHAGELADLYLRTKIGWNLHHSIGPVNTRVLELPANGVLQLCDNRSHLARIFALDREVVAFDTVAECIDKTRYYLAHDEERRAIAAAGWERVQREYTEAHQWRRIEALLAPLVAAHRGTGERAATSPGGPGTAGAAGPIAAEPVVPSPIAAAPQPRVPGAPRARRAPRVWLLADRRGWAYDREAQAMARGLAPEFECRVAYVQEQPDLAAWDFDLVWVFFWGETWHQRFVSDPRRVVKMLGSHRWQNDAAYGCLDPATFAERHLADAGHLAAISTRLVDLVAPVRAVQHAPQGIDAREFAPGPAKAGPLRVGWAGNRGDACKGIDDVLLPAAAERWPLRIAGGDRAPGDMAAFHRELDVLCIASTAEGGPLPLLEALACGAFVVTTDVGIAREVIQHGHNGLIVARSPAAFRAALHWCEANIEHLRAGRAERAAAVRGARSWDAVLPHRHAVLRRAFAALQADDPMTADAHVIVPPPPLGVVVPAAPRASPPPLPALAVGLLQRSYHAHLQQVSGEHEDTYRAASAYYHAELGALLPAARDAAICEVGCGFGHLLRFLAEHGYSDLRGVDLDADLAAATARRLDGRATITVGDAREFLAAHRGRFDLVLAYDILEHFDLDGALAFATAARAALRPGGTAVFRTPNMANLLGCYSRYMDLTHRIGFTEQSAAQLLAAAGFAEVALVTPEHQPGALRLGLERDRRLHERLFADQDRSRPRCFDKNLVLAARVPARMPAPAQAPDAAGLTA